MRKTTSTAGPQLQRKLSSTFEMDNKYENIMQSLLKQLDSKNAIDVRVSVMKTLSVLSQIMLNELEKYYGKTIPYIQESAGEGNNDLISHSLQILKMAFSRTSYDPTQVSMTAQDQSTQITEFLVKIISSSNHSKIISDALVVTGNFVRQLVDLEGLLDPAYKGCAIQLYDRVLSILQEQNIAQEVKQSCIVCIGKILCVSHEALSVQQIGEVYGILSDKLNAELTRESALKAMNLIAQNENTIKLTGLAQLEGQLLILMENANRSVRLATLQLSLTFLKNYPD
jgi:hypothetical protein